MYFANPGTANAGYSVLEAFPRTGVKFGLKESPEAREMRVRN
jgi:hypothetical protein